MKPGTITALGAGLVLLAATHHTHPDQTSAAGGNLKPGTVPGAYAALVDDAGRTCPQVTAALLAAQINQESGFDPRSVSETNAQGIAQFEPDTAASNHVNPWDPDSAIHGMARLDCAYTRRYGTVTLALAAYNGGPGILNHWQQVDQTRNYVASILAAVPHYTNTTTPAAPATPAPTATAPGTTGADLVRQLIDALRSAAAGTGSGS